MLKRLRQVLLVLVFAGTILNVWMAIDQRLSVIPLEAVPPEGSNMPYAGAYGVAIRQARIRTIWDHAAKVEFGIIIGAVCVWLLLPLAGSRTEAGSLK